MTTYFSVAESDNYDRLELQCGPHASAAVLVRRREAGLLLLVLHTLAAVVDLDDDTGPFGVHGIISVRLQGDDGPSAASEVMGDGILVDAEDTILLDL